MLEAVYIGGGAHWRWALYHPLQVNVDLTQMGESSGVVVVGFEPISKGLSFIDVNFSAIQRSTGAPESYWRCCTLWLVRIRVLVHSGWFTLALGVHWG